MDPDIRTCVPEGTIDDDGNIRVVMYYHDHTNSSPKNIFDCHLCPKKFRMFGRIEQHYLKEHKVVVIFCGAGAGEKPQIRIPHESPPRVKRGRPSTRPRPAAAAPAETVTMANTETPTTSTCVRKRPRSAIFGKRRAKRAKVKVEMVSQEDSPSCLGADVVVIKQEPEDDDAVDVESFEIEPTNLNIVPELTHCEPSTTDPSMLDLSIDELSHFNEIELDPPSTIDLCQVVGRFSPVDLDQLEKTIKMEVIDDDSHDFEDSCTGKDEIEPGIPSTSTSFTNGTGITEPNSDSNANANDSMEMLTTRNPDNHNCENLNQNQGGEDNDNEVKELFEYLVKESAGLNSYGVINDMSKLTMDELVDEILNYLPEEFEDTNSLS